MPIKSAYSSQNFKVSYFDRLSNTGLWLGDIDISLESWRHSISAFGGFDSASFSISDSKEVMEDWIQNGLFRPIKIYDNNLQVVWEGFIDSITINQAGLSISHGPVTHIANRVYAIYSGVDVSVYPPEIGVRKKTPTINNTLSQDDWGIWQEILSLAGVTDANADQLLDMYLAEHGEPEINGDFSFTRGEMSLSVECIGWFRTLNYPFNITDDTGFVTISTRIQEIIEAQPNSNWILENFNRIIPNSTTVPYYENDDQLAMEQIRGLTAMGDVLNNRHIFGVYEDRQPVYEQASQEIDYVIDISDPRQLIFNTAGAVIDPWQVRPGKWVFFSDVMTGLGPAYNDLHKDPRMLQIEQVSFDTRTPFAIQLMGGKTSSYEQRSARLGLRGINA